MDETKGKKNLVIDDKVYIWDSVIGFLEGFGFEVIEAENGKIGLEKFANEQPDLILCDLRMPEMDGLEVFAHVTRKDKNIPIIIVSGVGNISDTVEALHLGAWDYIIKRIQDMNVLSHAVNKAFLINMERAAEPISSFKQVAVDQSSENRRRFNLKEYMDEILLSLGPRYKKTGHVVQVTCEPDIELNSFPGAGMTLNLCRF